MTEASRRIGERQMEIMAGQNRRTSVYEADLLRIVEHTNSDEARAIACGIMYLSTLMTAPLASARAAA